MTLWFFALTLLLGTAWQAGVSSSADQQTCLLPAERDRLSREPKLDARIKIYDEANTRCETELTEYIQKSELQQVPSHLKRWMALLDISLKDIEDSKSRKEKSKALIKFEIHLRKSISTVQEAKLKAQVEQLEDFESWLTRADQIHTRLVGILFPK